MKFEISDENIGKRCDIVVLSHLHENGFKDITRSFLKNIWKNLVKVNQKDAKGSLILKKDDILEVDENTLRGEIEDSVEILEILPQEGKLEVIYENPEFMIVNKPSGVVIHPGIKQKENTLANYVVGYLQSKGEYDKKIKRGGIVHRLDKGVAGLVLFAKTYESQRFFQKKFEEREVEKVYLAEVHYKEVPKELKEFFYNTNLEVNKELDKLEKGNFICDDSWYRLEGYIHRSDMNRMKMRFSTKSRGKRYRYSLTFIKPLNSRQVIVKIETGRMHQIRAGLEYLGMTIDCDTLYETLKGRGGIPDEISLKSVLLSFEDKDFQRRIFRI